MNSGIIGASVFHRAKKSQDEFVRYVDGLSVDEILVLGIQATAECELKKGVSPKNKTKVENEYVMALGLILGRFVQRAETTDAVRLFTEAIGDSKAPLFWRRTLINMTPELQDVKPEVVRWNDYKLVRILGDIMKSPSEDAELRTRACRAVGLILQRERKKPAKSNKEKEILAKRISENMETCTVVANEANAPSGLVRMAQETLHRFK